MTNWVAVHRCEPVLVLWLLLYQNKRSTVRDAVKLELHQVDFYKYTNRMKHGFL